MSSGATPTYGLPYPLSTDPVNVASDIQVLATKLDNDLSEIIQDTSSTMITSGTNYGISTSYNDATGILNIGVIDDGHDHIISNIDGIQDALDLKASLASPTFTGTVTLPSATSIGTVSETEIGYLDNVTSSIQTQLNSKSPLISPTFTGTVVLPSTTSIGSVSSVEIGYIENVTSSIQTQIDSKASLASPAFTGNPTAPTPTTGDNDTSIATTAFVTSEIAAIGAAGVYYQTTAPASPDVGDVWVDSDEILIGFTTNDFMQKAGGTFTGLVSGITPVSNSNFATKQYVDNATPASSGVGLEAILMLAGM